MEWGCWYWEQAQGDKEGFQSQLCHEQAATVSHVVRLKFSGGRAVSPSICEQKYSPPHVPSKWLRQDLNPGMLCVDMGHNTPPKKVKTTLGVIPASGDRIREEAGVLGLYDATKRQVEESITFALAGLERQSVPK